VIINQVNEGFKRIQLSFKDIDSNISNEFKMIEKTSDLFTKIQVESENIASISEQQSASTEEMLATMEEQNISIDVIYSSMQKIKKLVKIYRVLFKAITSYSIYNLLNSWKSSFWKRFNF
ncbi:MAG: hypothetical protein ACYDG2_15395, partial [Ruminiclostridium sp.]